MITIRSNSVEDTDKLAKIISSSVFEGFLILANGDLGAGKTRFAKSLASYLGVSSNVTSPTFNILKCYFSGKLPLYHIDAYRLEDQINMDIGLEEVIEGDGVCVIEWGRFIEELIFEPLNIKISIINGNERTFEISSDFSKYDLIINKIKEELNV